MAALKNVTNTYTDINSLYSTPQDITTYIALVLIAIAIYMFIIGGFSRFSVRQKLGGR